MVFAFIAMMALIHYLYVSCSMSTHVPHSQYEIIIKNYMVTMCFSQKKKIPEGFHLSHISFKSVEQIIIIYLRI